MELLRQKPTIINSLALSTTLSATLLAARIVITGKLTYIFFAWNIFLAWLPLFAALYLLETKTKLTAFIVFSIWLVFLPNAPYIITDIFHFRQREFPVWYDLVLVFSFAWNGLMLGLASVLVVQTFLDAKFGERKSWLVIFTVMILCAFGMYIGRYERWNTWDVLLNPLELSFSILKKLIHPFRHREIYGMTILFSAMLFTCYLTLFSFTKMKNEKGGSK